MRSIAVEEILSSFLGGASYHIYDPQMLLRCSVAWATNAAVRARTLPVLYSVVLCVFVVTGERIRHRRQLLPGEPDEV